jgi:alginate O-acetyltransferase complex protein AlgI
VNFLSLTFLVFLVIVYAVYWNFLRGDTRKYFLIAASYVFYAWWDWRFCGLMLFVTVNAYWTGRVLPTLTARRRLRVLWASVGVDLGVLGVFKYSGFFAANATAALSALGLSPPVAMLSIVLPIGISFYTFHAISYVVDVYRGKVAAERSFADVALYIAFFPQLVAGPIVRAAFFMPQLRRAPPYSSGAQAHGVWLILRGLICKGLIADTLAEICDPVFADLPRHTDVELTTALLGFYAQIYFDFAGYSDIAIGTARLFGYRIPKNFDCPYAAASVTEFWRRWHMSLSFWLRDYVYIPLGGNRGSPAAFYRNLMVTMLLGGLWHGASWNFVAWGALHGLGLCAHKLWLGVRPRLGGINWDGWAWRAVALLLTQLWVLCAWAFFRCNSFADALEVLKAMVGLRHGGGRVLPTVLEMWIIAVVCADHLLRGAPYHRRPLASGHPIFWIGIGALAAAALTLMPLVEKPFIYFQF